MTTAIKAEVLELLVTIVIALLGLAGAYITVYISKLTKNLQEKTKAEVLNNALERLENLAVTTVTAIEQTLAEELREAVKDGKVDRSELEQLGTVAFQRVKTELGDSTIEALEGTFGDINTLIRDKIEEAVWNLKQEKEITNSVFSKN